MRYFILADYSPQDHKNCRAVTETIHIGITVNKFFEPWYVLDTLTTSYITSQDYAPSKTPYEAK